MFLSMMVLLAGAAAPQSVYVVYSPVYDQAIFRSRIPDCPALGIIDPRVKRVRQLWRTRFAQVMDRIRTVAKAPGFPQEPITIYLIGCGQDISDPITVSLFYRDAKKRLIAQGDEELLRDFTHELLHQVANLDENDLLQGQIRHTYPYESDYVLNHILVAAFETRLYGRQAVANRYERLYGQSGLRALELAMKFGIGSETPLP